MHATSLESKHQAPPLQQAGVTRLRQRAQPPQSCHPRLPPELNDDELIAQLRHTDRTGPEFRLQTGESRHQHRRLARVALHTAITDRRNPFPGQKQHVGASCPRAFARQIRTNDADSGLHLQVRAPGVHRTAELHSTALAHPTTTCRRRQHTPHPTAKSRAASQQHASKQQSRNRLLRIHPYSNHPPNRNHTSSK